MKTNKQKVTKVKFVIKINPSLMVKVGGLMSSYDLSITGVVKPEFYICKYKTTADVDKKYIARMKREIKKGFELDGNEVSSVTQIK